MGGCRFRVGVLPESQWSVQSLPVVMGHREKQFSLDQWFNQLLNLEVRSASSASLTWWGVKKVWCLWEISTEQQTNSTVHEVPEPSRAYLVWLCNEYKSSQLECLECCDVFFPRFPKVFWAGRQRLQTCSSPKKTTGANVKKLNLHGDRSVECWDCDSLGPAQRVKSPESKLRARDSKRFKGSSCGSLMVCSNPKRELQLIVEFMGELYVLQLLQGFLLQDISEKQGRRYMNIYTKMGPQNASFHLLQPPPSQAPCGVPPFFFVATQCSALPGSGSAHHGNFFQANITRFLFVASMLGLLFFGYKNRMNDLPGAQPGAWWDTNHFFASLQIPSLSVGALGFFLWWMSS